MHRTSHPTFPGNRLPLTASVAAVLTAFGLASAVAQAQGVSVVRVEEDWELVVKEPDSNIVAPQVVCTMSPVGNVTGDHATFELNHQSLPDFVPGGIQLQMWSGEYPLASRKFPNGAVMSTSSETVHWTSAMAITEGGVLFEIIDGDSTTWGQFGGQGYLRDTLASGLANLDGYNPAVSVSDSGVSYASNRVQSLVLKRVRLYTSDGQVHEDATSRVVYEEQQP